MTSRDQGVSNFKVSVVMSVYNGERFLKQAIDSMLSQTFEDFEFIIIDDGSKDRSSQIVKSYKDPRIQLVNQENHGFIYSLNKGVSLAKCDLIARMDQDDISLPTRLEKQFEAMAKNPKLGAVSTFFELINFADGQPVGITSVFPIKDIDIKRYMYLNNPMAHGATMFRKKAWSMAGGYSADYAPPEDFDLWRKIAQKWDLALIPEVLFQYRINNPESMSQKNLAKNTNNFEKIKNEIAMGSFLRKSFASLLKDYYKIDKKTYKHHRSAVKKSYKEMQFTIANTFIDYIAPRKALDPLLFSIIVTPIRSRHLVRKYPRSLLINMLRRSGIRKK